MTEKTPKTPRSDQADDLTKDQSATSGTPPPVPTDDIASGPAPKAAKTTPEKESPVTPDVAAAKKTPVKPEPSAAKVSPEKPAQQTPSAGSGSGGRTNGKTSTPVFSEPSKKPSAIPLAVVAVAVVLLAGVVWYQHTTSQGYIDRLESQAASSAEQARLAAQQAQQALNTLNDQQGMLAALRSELRESRAELNDLNSAFQTITDRGSDLVLLNDIDHLVVIAQQQLQLNGNVANAIISLETAQAQLARANRPTLASLQQTINGDLDRLRAATTVDIALLSSRLDELAGLVSQAPLLVPDDAVPNAGMAPNGSAQGAGSPSRPDTSGPDDNWWQKALARTQQWSSRTFASLRQDLGQFISVRRVDDAAALLISPDQATRFRDSLRQRIMTAQLALMMDQSMIWETETDALLKAVESRFDPQSALTRQAIKIARDVADTAIDTPLPSVTNSIKALEAMSEQMGRRSLPEQPATDQPEQTTETPSQGLESSASERDSAADSHSDDGPDDTESPAAADDAVGASDAVPGFDDTPEKSGAESSTDDATDNSVDKPGTGNIDSNSDLKQNTENAAPTSGAQQGTENNAVPGTTHRADDAVDDSTEEAVDDADAERIADDNVNDLQSGPADSMTDNDRTNAASTVLYQTTGIIKQSGTQG